MLAASAAALVVAILGGAGASEHLSSGGFEVAGSESSRASAALERHFGAGDPDLVLLVTATTGSVDDPEVAAAGRDLTRRLGSEPGVTDVVSYWSLSGAAPLRSRYGTQAMIVARLEGDLDHRSDLAAAIAPRYAVDQGGPVEVRVGGFQEAFRQTVTQIEHDLVRAELIIGPVMLVLLLVVFRSLVAALLPLAVGGLAVTGTLLILRLLASVTEVSVFALNLTTGLGLGLAIDYSLFVVSRYREEVAQGADRDSAVVRTVQTAGRMVAFSALTVAASLSSLLLFPMAFLRSFAYAGIPVVLLAAAGAVVTLPALLAAVGDGLDRFAVRRPGPDPVGEGWWHRVATSVMRRPLPVATAVVIGLLVLGAPFLRFQAGLPDDRVLPPTAPVRAVHDDLRRGFDGAEAFPVLAVATGLAPPEQRTGEVDRYAAAVSALPGVLRVDAETGSYVGGERLFHLEPLAQRFRRPDATYLAIVPAVDPISPEARQLVDRIRATEAPFTVEVAGRTAMLVDNAETLRALLPWAFGAIAGVTFVLLLLAFGSLLVPVKAVVLNLLSLTATFGAMVWVFQEGHLSGLLGFTPTGTLDMAMPILMFAIAFGMSMDYEVFLLSRIHEEYLRTGDNTTAIAVGLERTGRLITAAAILIAAVLLAVGTSGVSIIKMFGLGLSLAVLVDASLVRALLVPAFMRLAGDANWWAPRWLSRAHLRRAGIVTAALLLVGCGSSAQLGAVPPPTPVDAAPATVGASPAAAGDPDAATAPDGPRSDAGPSPTSRPPDAPTGGPSDDDGDTRPPPAGSEHPTDSPASDEPPSSAATPREAGTYRYDTDGRMEVSGGTPRDLPDVTTLEVRPATGNVQLAIRDLRDDEGRGQLTETTLRYADRGVLLSRIKVTTALGGGLTDTREWVLDPPELLVASGAGPGYRRSFAMSGGDTTAQVTVELLRVEPVEVDGQRLETVVTRVHVELSGALEGTQTTTSWMRPADLLAVQEHFESDVRNGLVRIVTEYRATLTSVEPVN